MLIPTVPLRGWSRRCYPQWVCTSWIPTEGSSCARMLPTTPLALS